MRSLQAAHAPATKRGSTCCVPLTTSDLPTVGKRLSASITIATDRFSKLRSLAPELPVEIRADRGPGRGEPQERMSFLSDEARPGRDRLAEKVRAA